MRTPGPSPTICLLDHVLNVIGMRKHYTDKLTMTVQMKALKLDLKILVDALELNLGAAARGGSL